MAVDRPDVRGSILSATTTRPADAPASPGTSAATPSGAGGIDPASAGTAAAPPGSAAGPAQAAPATTPRVKDGFDLMAKPPLPGSEGVPGAPVSSSPAGAPLKVVEVSQAKVQQLRAELERRSDTLDRRTRRAVDSLFARASQPLPPGVTVARSQEGAAERLTLTRRDPEGRIVSIESGEREGERAEYQRTDWMGERATRRTLQTGERASERITRNESWPATPSAQPQTPSTGELHAQAQQGQAVEIHEERYGRETVGNDEHFAHTEHEASTSGERTTTERYSRPVSMPGLPAHVEKELEPGKPLDVVERTTSERTYEGGKASEPKESKQTAASQGNRRVTQVEQGGERSFVVERQEGEKYSAQTYKPGSTQPAETVERVAKGSTVLETVERRAEKGKDPKPTSARVETEYEHSGVVRRRDVRSTDSDGARTHQVYASSEQKTEQGLETHERVDVTLELKSPEGTPEPATYHQRREVHGLVGPNGWQLLGTREEMRGPSGETACATFDEHGARLTVNGKEVPLGDPAASPLPTSGRELAALVLSGAAGLVRKYVEATQPRAPEGQAATQGTAEGQAGELGHPVEGGVQLPATEHLEPQGAHGQQQLPAQPGTSAPEAQLPLATQDGRTSAPLGDFKPGVQQQPASKPFEPQGAQGQQRPSQPGTSTPDPRVPLAAQGGRTHVPLGDLKPGAQQQPASHAFEPQGAQGQQRPPQPGTSTPDPRVPLATQDGRTSAPLGDFKPGVQQQPASHSFEPQSAQGQQRPPQPGTSTPDPRVPLATQDGRTSAPIGDFKPGVQQQPASKQVEAQGTRGQQQPSQPGTSTPDPRVPLATQGAGTSGPLGGFQPGAQQQPASQPFEPQGSRGQAQATQRDGSAPESREPLSARDSRTGAPLTESRPGAQRPTSGRADPRTPPSGVQRGSTPQGTAVPVSARDARTPALGEPKPTTPQQPRGEARSQQARDQQAPVPLGESHADPTIQAQAESGTPRSAPTSARSPDRAPTAETPARRGDSPQPQSAGRTTPANDARAPRAPSDRPQPAAPRTPAPEGKRSQPGTTPAPSSARSQTTASGARRDISSDARAPETHSEVAPEVSPDVEPARTDDPRDAPEAERTAESADYGSSDLDITLPGHRFTGSSSPRASSAVPDRANARQTPPGAPTVEITRAEEPPRSATPARASSESGRSSVFNATPSGQPSPSNVSNTPSWEQRLAEVLRDPEIQSALKNLDNLREPNTPVGRLLQSASSLLAAVQQANEAQGLKIMAERSAPAMMPAVSPRARREEPRGGRLGKYQLLKRIGAGGMGEVFLARSGGARGFQKDLVIKRILPHLAEDEHFLSLFLDEARIAARLNHPNIAQIFELGEAGGSFYLAMEHVNGPDLKRIVRQSKKSNKPVPLGTACRIVADVAAGLEYAHKARDSQGTSLGIIHRDVSPHNILVSFEGAVKLIDFGVAKALDRSTQTGVGAFRGKIPYTAPEQLDGKAADARSDVFSLGVVFWELLTNRRLFEAPNEPATILLVSECRVPAPSTVNRTIPRSLDEIALKALAKDPARRYADAVSFRRALEGFAVSSRLPASSVDVETYLHDLFAAEQALAGDSRSTPALGERSPSGNTKATPAPARTRGVTPAYGQARMEATPGPDLERTLIDGSLPAEDEREEPLRPTLPAIRIVNPR